MASDAIDRLQGLRSGVAVKAPARAVATSNITLSGEQTVDGVALVAGDRALVTGQSSAAGNGVYDVSTGAWTRSLDFDGVNDLTAGTMLLVLEGTSYGATMWRLDAAGTPDEDALTFSSGVWVADGAIGTAELAALCVTTAKLAAEAVTAAKLATDAVETAKIKDANVTAAKLATDAVETAKIKDANVTAAKLATDAVETAKIKDANVTAAKLATDAVETAKIKDANVTEAKLATDAVSRVAKVGFTRSLASGAGSQAVTGVGFTPKAVVLLATVAGTPSMSIGFSAGVSASAVLYDDSYSSAGAYATAGSGNHAISLYTAAGVYGKATVASLDADGFTLTWSTSGSPTGTANCYALCFR